MYILEKTYIGSIISDIHFGALDANRLNDELDEYYLKYLKSLKILDFCIIAGDLFDTKLSMNSEHTKYAFIFFQKLIDICKKKNTKLRIIKGTESHDNKQLEILRILNMSGCDTRIISTVESEYLFDDLKILYLPEEYMPDKDEFYKKYFDETYDMIFGHGLVNEVAFKASTQESETTMNNAPVFHTKKLLEICKGPIFFGHIHESMCIRDRFYYCGSFTRWAFGEETNKGSYIVAYSPDTAKYTADFIVNYGARSYATMTIDFESDFYKKDESQQIEHIVQLVANSSYDRLRIVFNIPEDYPNPLLLSNVINDVCAKYKNIKIVINNNNKEAQQKRTMETKIKQMMDTYGFIFDKGLPTEDKLSMFIKKKYNRDISIDKMREYLYQKINMDV